MFYAAEYVNNKVIRVYGFKTAYGRSLYMKMHLTRDIRNISPTLAEEYIADNIRYEEF